MKGAICPLMYANMQGTIASEPPSFGISLHTALLLWMVLNVPNEGPSGEKQILLWWMLMFFERLFKWQELIWTMCDRIPSTTPGAEPPRDARDSGSARSHSTHLETSSSNRP